LGNGSQHTRVSWGLNYVREKIDYADISDSDAEIISVNARRPVTSTLGLLGEAGYESYDYRVIGPAEEGPRWSLGFEWTPSARTRLAATAGQRFYGDAYSFDFGHRARLVTVSAYYHEEITSTRSQFFVPATSSTAGYLDALFVAQFPDPVARQKAVDEFIAQTGLPDALSAPIDFYTNQLFLMKRWGAAAGVIGARNVVIANVSKDTRRPLVSDLRLPGTGDFEANNTVVQVGAGLLWNWRISARTFWNAALTISEDRFPSTGRTDNLAFLSTELSRRMQPRVYGALNYRRQQRKSSEDIFAYTENSVTAVLRYAF
jgi:uncharacterized protein (PEP-CTERM system associated)